MANLSWQQVALVFGLLAAVILAGLFAPGVISIVSSVVSTLVGAFFVNVNGKKEDKTPDTLPSPAPVLQLVPKEGEKGVDA